MTSPEQVADLVKRFRYILRHSHFFQVVQSLALLSLINFRCFSFLPDLNLVLIIADEQKDL